MWAGHFPMLFSKASPIKVRKDIHDSPCFALLTLMRATRSAYQIKQRPKHRGQASSRDRWSTFPFQTRARWLLRGVPHRGHMSSPSLESYPVDKGRVNMQTDPLRKTYSWDWPFTCTYCSIVLCFDVRSTWEISKRKKRRKLDRSFCMIWVELLSYVSVTHVYLSFYFGYLFPKWKFPFIVLLIVMFLFWFLNPFLSKNKR